MASQITQFSEDADVSLAKRSRQDDPLHGPAQDLSGIAGPALEETHSLFQNFDLPIELAKSMSSLGEIRRFIKATKGSRGITNAQITLIGNLPANPLVVLNAFTEYCSKHPTSFLNLVCKPAFEMMLKSHPGSDPQHTLNQVLFVYLGDFISPKTRIRDVENAFEHLETLYTTVFEGSYEVFFTHLLNARIDQHLTLGSWLDEAVPPSRVLGIEKIGRIIQKLKNPSYEPLLAQIKELSIKGKTLKSFHIPIEWLLLSGLQTFTVSECSFSDIQLRESSELTQLSLEHNYLKSINLALYPKLSRLHVPNNHLESLDLQHNPTLCHIDASHNQLKELDISHNPDITYLNVADNALRSSNLHEARSLQFLNVRGNQLEQLDLSHKPNLREIEASGNRLKALDVTQTPALHVLYVSGNELQTLDLRYNSDLLFLNASMNKLEALDLSYNSTLEALNVSDNRLETLTLPNNRFLKRLYASNNHIQAIDVSGNTSLEYIDLRGNPLKTLDLSRHPHVQTVLVDPGVHVIRAGQDSPCTIS